MNSDLLTILLAIVGTGGLGTVFINVIANRKLNKAKETMTLAEGYEKRLAVLTGRICDLENSTNALNTELQRLKGLLTDREAMIEILQKENKELKKELDIFKESSKAKDERILALEARVTDLTERLNKITGKRR